MGLTSRHVDLKEEWRFDNWDWSKLGVVILGAWAAVFALPSFFGFSVIHRSPWWGVPSAVDGLESFRWRSRWPSWRCPRSWSQWRLRYQSGDFSGKTGRKRLQKIFVFLIDPTIDTEESTAHPVSRCCLTWLWKWGSTSRLVISNTLYWEVGWSGFEDSPKSHDLHSSQSRHRHLDLGTKSPRKKLGGMPVITPVKLWAWGSEMVLSIWLVVEGRHSGAF